MRSAFDLSPDLVYLNSANLSVCPRTVITALDRYHREYEKNPTEGLAKAWGQLWAVQGRLARFLGAEPSDLFLRTNVTAVLNTFLLGVPLEKGSEILFGELEYGAIVNVCRLRAKRDGLSTRIIKFPTTPFSIQRCRSEELLENIVSQIGPRTRLILLSHILGVTGMRLPIRELAKITRARGIILVVDGAYAPGAIPVNFQEFEDVDFYGCSLYKWLMGPKGTAFGWVPKRNQSILEPINAGWATFEPFGPFAEFGENSSFQSTFLMNGCHDFAPFRAIHEMIDYWEEQSVSRILDRRKNLEERLAQGIKSRLGWQPLWAEDPGLVGPLVAARLPEKMQKSGSQIVKFLYDQYGIQINCVRLGPSSWCAVLSPHHYNTDDEIEKALVAFQKL